MSNRRITRIAAVSAFLLASLLPGPAIFGDAPPPVKAIARVWRGWVRSTDAVSYFVYLRDNGTEKIKKIPGNLGVEMFSRGEGGKTEFVVISYWSSPAAIQNFTGPDWEKVKALPDDPKYLVPPAASVTHYEVLIPR